MASDLQKTRGYILPDPVTGYDLICVKMKIPDVLEYRNAFYGQMYELMRYWTWEQSGVRGDTRASQAAKYWQSLIEQHYQLGECDLYLLRQNSDEPCLLEQSINGGETWSLAFDYSLCMTTDPATKYLLKLQVDIQAAGWQADYIAGGSDDIGDVFPDTVYDDTAADDFRDAALCYALRGYVIGISEASAQTIEANQAIVDNVAYALGLAAGATGLWAGFGLAFWIPLGLALGALGASIASEVLGNEALSYRDSEAQEDVICFMYNRLKGDTVQASDFLNALAGETFTGNAAKIADVVALTLNDITSYLAFMNIVSEGFTMAQQGVIEACNDDCNTPFCKEFDFTVDNGGWSVLSPNGGSYVASTYWSDTNLIISGNRHKNLGIYRTFERCTVQSVRVHYTANVSQNDLAQTNKIIGLLESVVVFTATETPATRTNHTFEWTGDEIIDELQVIGYGGSKVGTGAFTLTPNNFLCDLIQFEGFNGEFIGEECDNCPTPIITWDWEGSNFTVYPITYRGIENGFPFSGYSYATGNITNGHLPQLITGFDATCDYNWFKTQLYWTEGASGNSRTVTIKITSDPDFVDILATWTESVPHNTIFDVNHEFASPVTGLAQYYVDVAVVPREEGYGFYQAPTTISTEEQP